MKISEKEWLKYRNSLSRINKKAEQEFVSWIDSQGGYAMVDKVKAVNYAYALATKYGEASASLSAMMYDEIANFSGADVPPAEVAETATYQEVAKAINGAAKISTLSSYLGGVVGRLVKQAGADTTLKNAQRDHAMFAWIPAGETCVFCLALAAEGWKYASKKGGSHAKHIHSNCDCTYAVRFDKDTKVGGYDPDKYRQQFKNAEGDTFNEKKNSLRREYYDRNKDEINEHKRIAYEENNES